MRTKMIVAIAVVCLAAGVTGCPTGSGGLSIALSTESLSFDESTTQRTFEVSNGSAEDGVLNFSLAADVAWVDSISPASGQSSGPDDATTVTVTVDPEQAGKATFNGTLTVTADGADTKTIALTLLTGEDSLDDEGEGAGEGEGEAIPETERSRVVGWVSSTGGARLPGVTVTLDRPTKQGQITTTTSAEGLYAFDNATPGEGLTILFEREGYTANAQYVDVFDGATTTANAVLKAYDEPVLLSSAADGGVVTDGSGENKVDIPAGGLVDEDGNSITGPVEVRVTPLDLSDPDELSAFPGNFRAMEVGAKQGEVVLLETFGLIDIQVTQTTKQGEVKQLNLGENQQSEIEIRLPDDTTLQPGDEVPLWYFDEEQGIWMEDPNPGTVAAASDDTSALAYYASVSHFSWWNCDRPYDTHCLTGRLVDENGDPIVGAQVVAEGISYNGSDAGTTDANGNFCVEGMRGGTVRLTAYLPGSFIAVELQTTNLPDTMALCEDGGCTPLGDIEIRFDSCIAGRVTDEDGVPVAGAVVYSSFGGTAVTDANGDYCLAAPAGETVDVYILGRPVVPVTTPLMADCATGGCAPGDISIEFPEDGDLVGYVGGSISEEAGAMGLASSAFFFAQPGTTLSGLLEEQLDNCTVTIDTGEEEGEGEDFLPNSAEGLGALDPGAPGMVSSNMNSAEMVRASEYFAGLGDFGFNFNFGPGLFFQDPSVLEGVSHGDTANYSWPGGVDIGPFSFDISIPGELVVTQPEITQQTNGENTVMLDLTSPLQFTWNAANPGDLVSISVAVYAPDGTIGSVNCVVEDDGSHTIGTDLLSQLPGEGRQVLSVGRLRTKEVMVPLTRGGEGVVLGSVSDSIYATSDEEEGETDSGFELYTFPLDGNQVVPPSGSDASGCATVSVSSFGGFSSVSISGSHGVTDSTTASFRRGAAGETGTEVVPLTANPATEGNQDGFFSGSWTNPTAQDLQDLRDGNFHIVILSESNPAGEIRGQLSQAGCQ